MQPGVPQYFAPGDRDNIVYYPSLVGCAEMRFSNARYGVETARDVACSVEFDDGATTIDWDGSERLEVTPGDLSESGHDEASFAELPVVATKAKNYTQWKKNFSRWVRQNETLTLYRSKKYRLTSEGGETEGEFRIRLQQAANEKRDIAVQKLRKRYASKMTTLDNRLMRAEQTLEVQKEQATSKKFDTAISIGTTILDAVLGRKRVSSSRIGTAARRAGSARKEASDVARAKATVKKVQKDIAELELRLADEVNALEASFDAQDETLDEVVVKAKVSDVHVAAFGLLWVPYADRGDGRLEKI